MKYFLVVCIGKIKNEADELVTYQSIVMVEAESYEQAVNIIQSTRQANGLDLFESFMNATIHQDMLVQVEQDSTEVVEEEKSSDEE